MAIITSLGVDSNQKTCYERDNYRERLAKGEAWEEGVFNCLRANGLSADRYRQDMSMVKRRELFPKFQRDGFIQMAWGRLNIEVKARSGYPFNWSTVHVGRKTGWDVKAFPIHYMIVVCQETGISKVTKADKNSRGKYWVTANSKDLCYTVPYCRFMSLEEFISNLLKGRIPDSHRAFKKFGWKFDGQVRQLR